ncbi:MAG: hypothetical protein ACRDAM_10560 [Casimicrobium sp.]
MHRYTVIGLLALLAQLSAPVSAQVAAPPSTVDEFLRGYQSFSRSKCAEASNSSKKENLDIRTAYALKSGHRNICECVPARVSQLRASLSPAERNAKLTAHELSEMFIPRIMEPCAAEQLRLTYSDADGCTERFAGLKANSAKYCACMFKHANDMSDKDAMHLGLESSNYTTLAAEAKRRGAAAPPQSTKLKQLFAKDIACSAE